MITIPSTLYLLAIPLSVRIMRLSKISQIQEKEQKAIKRINDLVFHFKNVLATDKTCYAFDDCKQCPDHVPRNNPKIYTQEEIKTIAEKHLELSPEMDAEKIEAHLQTETKRKAKEVRAVQRSSTRKKPATKRPSRKKPSDSIPEA